ncbi:MAG: leucyl aminopeptidase family protein [Caulobacter sp.]|nr:leucyl aminopeptidase family protein [Caulobacter sp.]
MTDPVIASSDERAIPLRAVTAEAWPDLLAARPASLGRLAETGGFKAGAGQLLLVHDDAGEIAEALFGLGAGDDAFAFRGLAARLPAGDYVLAEPPEGLKAEDIALAFWLGGYRFDRYRAAREAGPRLVAGEGVDLAAVKSLAHACALARDMVNTPASDMGPLQIETIAREIAEQHGATLTVATGDELLAEGYPAVHAVGRAAGPGRDPRIIELSWSGPGAAADAPLVAIVGKGVTFDTGGLDIKPSAGMRLMKKDMGGAAHALALARMVMDAALPVRLAVLVPAVENAISGDAMRPGDVLATRKGLTVEVGNTDAEGRLILADALARAHELSPDLTIDMATLTGAARIALGPQVIPFYTDDEALAADIASASLAARDPLWRMPLWAGYEDALTGEIADLRNDPEGWAQAGSVTAALFLKRFAPTSGAWVHLDIFAWNPKGRPGWPVGGEAQAIRALFAMLKARFG